jgi:hypothetical protein
MATEKQIAANRRNAQKSTGPQTEAGKARSSKNAVRYGIYADLLAPADACSLRFRALLRGLVHEHSPLDPAQRELVESMAAARWRILQLWLGSGPRIDGATTRSLEVLLRAESSLERQFCAARSELLRLRNYPQATYTRL